MAAKMQSDFSAEMKHPQTSVVQADVEQDDIDLQKEKKLVRKIDLRVVPILFLLFLCAFMDRINIGNARIQGLEKDLHMRGNDYNISLFLFFIPYILLEVPSNMLLKKIRPSIFLSAIIFGWGVVTIGQGVTKSYAGLLVCRILIGTLEAGFFPGCIYLISMYYRRHELQWRINLFFSASIFAGAFSGLLAYGLAHMSGIAGYSGWRWIFIIEGLFTVVVAACAFFVVPDWPQTAKFLSQEEKDLLLRRLSLDVEETKMDHWTKAAAWRVFTDVKIYLGTLMYLGIVTSSYSIAFFTPTILRQLGWTAVRAQVMSIPVYLAAAVCSLTVALATDYLRHRYSFILLGCGVATIGHAILLDMIHVPVGARYFALYCISCGAIIAQPVILVWLSNNLAGHYKRGVGAAVQIGFGNVAGIIASLVFVPQQVPTYRLGFGMCLGLVWLTVVSATVMFWYVKRENRLRDMGARDHVLADAPESEKDNLGDDHPNFRFTT